MYRNILYYKHMLIYINVEEIVNVASIWSLVCFFITVLLQIQNVCRDLYSNWAVCKMLSVETEKKN